MKTEIIEEYFEQSRFKNLPRFHWRDHTYFIRHENGDVSVVRFNEFNGTTAAWVDFRIPALEWVSIITSMSKGGETTESYEQMRNWH